MASPTPLHSASVALTGHGERTCVGSITSGHKHVVTDVPSVVTLEHFSFPDQTAFIYVTPCPYPPGTQERWSKTSPKGGVGTQGLTAAWRPQAKHFEPVVLKLESANMCPGI